MFGIVEKSPLGPIVEPKPGPTLDIDVAAPEIEVTKSSPVEDSICLLYTSPSPRDCQ